MQIIHYPERPTCYFQEISRGDFFLVETKGEVELFLKIDPINTDRYVWNAIDCGGLPESFNDTDAVIPIDIEININYKRD